VIRDALGLDVTRASASIVNHIVNSPALDRAFTACAHPIRRAILERLARSELTVGEATGDFGVSKPAISRHLRVLEEAGAITRVVEGRTHRLRLSGQGLAGARDWISQRSLWERKFDVIEEYLATRPATEEDPRS
jgi:DNA-binding transcriptional ArsR family regulator